MKSAVPEYFPCPRSAGSRRRCEDLQISSSSLISLSTTTTTTTTTADMTAPQRMGNTRDRPWRRDATITTASASKEPPSNTVPIIDRVQRLRCMNRTDINRNTKQPTTATHVRGPSWDEGYDPDDYRGWWNSNSDRNSDDRSPYSVTHLDDEHSKSSAMIWVAGSKGKLNPQSELHRFGKIHPGPTPCCTNADHEEAPFDEMEDSTTQTNTTASTTSTNTPLNTQQLQQDTLEQVVQATLQQLNIRPNDRTTTSSSTTTTTTLSSSSTTHVARGILTHTTNTVRTLSRHVSFRDEVHIFRMADDDYIEEEEEDDDDDCNDYVNYDNAPTSKAGSDTLYTSSSSSSSQDYRLHALDSLHTTTQPHIPSGNSFFQTVAAIVIQAFYRRHAAYQVALRRYRAIFVIQDFYRTHVQSKPIWYKNIPSFYDLAATRIQAIVRGWMARESILMYAYCATLIQNLWRQKKTTTNRLHLQTLAQYQAQEEESIEIQLLIRKWKHCHGST